MFWELIKMEDKKIEIMEFIESLDYKVISFSCNDIGWELNIVKNETGYLNAIDLTKILQERSLIVHAIKRISYSEGIIVLWCQEEKEETGIIKINVNKIYEKLGEEKASEIIKIITE